MRFVIGGLILVGTLSAQHVGVINTGPAPAPVNAYRFGNILFPGGVPSHPARLGATIAGKPIGFVSPGIHSNRGFPSHRPNRTVVVPYAYPVFLGSDPYGYGYGQQPAQNITVVVPQQPTPSVVINHNYVPETAKPVMRDYTNEELPEGKIRSYEAPGPQPRDPEPAARRADDRPTIYLIALKDSSVQSAIGYWVEGGTLHYVTPHGVVNRVTLDRVDRELTQQLNSERNVEFTLKD